MNKDDNMNKDDKKKQEDDKNKGENKMMNIAMKTNSSDIKDGIFKLQKRALDRKNNSELRHTPRDSDLKIASENFKDLEHEVYSNIAKKED